MSDRGVLYIATGDDFVKEATAAARIMRRNAGHSATIISDRRVEADVFDSSVVFDDPTYGFGDKITGLQETPYDRTIFLDTDTYVTDDLSAAFEVLAEFDIAVAHNSAPEGRDTHEMQSIPETFPEYNTGVVAYRSTNRTDAFLESWLRAYEDADEHPHDQPSFRDTLYRSNLRVATLPPEYNCLFRYPGYVVGSVRVFHGRLQSVDGPGADQYFDIKTAVERINTTTANRVFTGLGGISVYTNRKDTLLGRARMSARQHGYRHLLREGITELRNGLRRWFQG